MVIAYQRASHQLLLLSSLLWHLHACERERMIESARVSVCAHPIQHPTNSKQNIHKILDILVTGVGHTYACVFHCVPRKPASTHHPHFEQPLVCQPQRVQILFCGKYSRCCAATVYAPVAKPKLRFGSRSVRNNKLLQWLRRQQQRQEICSVFVFV